MVRLIYSAIYRMMIITVTIVLLGGCTQHDASSENANQQPLPFLSGTGVKAKPDYTIQFPQDHLAHPDFDIEWWYLTSNLIDAQGNQYAFQWTLFRFANPAPTNAWSQGQVYMGHASLHSPQQHWFNEKFAAGGVGSAGIEADPLHYFIDTMSWQSEGVLRFPSQVRAIITQPDSRASVNLQLNAPSDFVLHGKDGYSIKTADKSHASHYYSQPFIEVTGALNIDGQTIPVSGQGWYDHEWSSQLVNSDTLGWDWLSLHFDNGDKLMAFTMRTQHDKYVTGTYITQAGDVTIIPPEAINMQHALHSTKYPTQWTISVPNLQVDLNIQALKVDAENQGVFTYYEGAVQVTGSHTGVGFLEMTGY